MKMKNIKMAYDHLSQMLDEDCPFQEALNDVTKIYNLNKNEKNYLGKNFRQIFLEKWVKTRKKNLQ